jgi:uncharacterized protein (DUF3084 family)
MPEPSSEELAAILQALVAQVGALAPLAAQVERLQGRLDELSHKRRSTTSLSHGDRGAALQAVLTRLEAQKEQLDTLAARFARLQNRIDKEGQRRSTPASSYGEDLATTPLRTVSDAPRRLSATPAYPTTSAPRINSLRAAAPTTSLTPRKDPPAARL